MDIRARLTRLWPNRGKVGQYVTILPSLPLALGSWVLVIFLCLIWVVRWRSLRFEPPAVLTGEWRPWVVRFFNYSFTLVRAVLYVPGARDEIRAVSTRTETHEHGHVRQYEDYCWAASVVAGASLLYTGDLWHSLALWVSPAVWWIPWYLTAWLRGGDPYKDVEAERAIYAQTDIWNGSSWLERRMKALAKEKRAPKRKA